jgi:hypothetical protein
VFSQTFIILLGLLLIHIGLSDINPLGVLLGIFVALNASFTLFQVKTGKALTSFGFKEDEV